MQRVDQLKVFKKRFVFVFLILSISLVFFSCAGYSYEGYYPVPITTSENTYIRFRFENKRSEEEKQLLNDKDRYWKFFSYGFHVWIWTNSKLFTNVKKFRTINPEMSYWQRYYKPGTLYYRVGVDSLTFVEGCEYKMPIPVGKTKYKFSFGVNDPDRAAALVKTIDVPPNHSIRVVFDIGGPPQDDDEEDENVIRSRDFKKKRVPIRISVEPNPEPDEDKICELPKHPRD
ncbi:hypothetical protein [Leptospira interrogans]|uniref:hypothetical protein n=2 Tax=Leptospira interrogans TaxID=173 RepID=UPI000297EBC2|nr:hypothetical protein [Leptospira interrogans]AJR16551.1 hypothetical protein LIL_30012 [Leptospira interrogans serovar Linhai str. 56609]EKR82459.1 putative lipoprotein [Leptospira interrogans str. UI 08452]EMN34485.1 putative lipoprotein [Leptospira interrogans serovar Medanensis str. L0448]EMN40754.1 putative lipoprotein [Leptospira interrogans str. L0996]